MGKVSIKMDSKLDDSVVVLSNHSAVVKVTALQAEPRARPNGTPSSQRSRRSPGQTRPPHFGIPKEERDKDLEAWVAETRKRYKEVDHQLTNNNDSKDDEASLHAPLASMETLSDPSKCGNVGISGCLPPALENAGARLRSVSKSPKIKRKESESPRLTKVNLSTHQAQMSRQYASEELESSEPKQTVNIGNEAIGDNSRDMSALDNTDHVQTALTSNLEDHCPFPLPIERNHPGLVVNTDVPLPPNHQSSNNDLEPHSDHPNSPSVASLLTPSEHQDQDLSQSEASLLSERSSIPSPLIFPPHPEGLEVEASDLGPPPPYTPPSSEDWKLLHVDFPPRCIDGGGILHAAVFETLDILMDRVNRWLKRHPSAQVKSLETVEQRTTDTAPNSTVNMDTPTIADVETAGTLTVKALRMWIEPKPFHARHLPPQQIGYINVVPACINPGNVHHRPEFDSQLVTLHKFNKIMKHRPMPGKVLNVETIAMKFRQYSKWVEPDRCHYRQHNDISTSYLSMFRIYYQVGEPCHDEIGFRDFKPEWHESAHNRSTSRGFDDFGQLVAEANHWAHSVPDLRILNFQTITCKVKLTKNKRAYINTERAINTIYNSSDQVQSLRVWYALPCPSSGHHQHSNHQHARNDHLLLNDDPPPLNCITSKVFYPLRLSAGGMFDGQHYESLAETRQRMKAWLQANPGVSIVSAETTKMKLDPNHSPSNQLNVTYFPARCDGTCAWIYLFRLYIDGDTSEPYRNINNEDITDEEQRTGSACAIL